VHPQARRAVESHGLSAEIVVADNGSTDGSQAIAARLGARVVPVTEKSYGSALRGGIAAARGRYVIMGDADDSYPGDDAGRGGAPGQGRVGLGGGGLRRVGPARDHAPGDPRGHPSGDGHPDGVRQLLPEHPKHRSPSVALMTQNGELAPPLSSRLARYVHFDRINRPYLHWQVEQFLPYLGQRVLEIGCGVGGIINLLGHRELIYGLDVEADVLTYAAERFRGRPECRFALCDVTAGPSEWPLELQTQRFDSVICVNVLEHIDDDIAALRRMEQFLVPGGTLALLVPAHQALYGPYDKLDGHFRRYGKAHLQRLLRQTGLEPLRLRYFNSVGAAGWWVQYKLLRRSIHGEGQFGIMNRILPALRQLERVIPPPFGLSLVAVCHRGNNSSAEPMA